MALDIRDKAAALYKANKKLQEARKSLFHAFNMISDVLKSLAMFDDEGDVEIKVLWTEMKAFLEDGRGGLSEDMIKWNTNVININKRLQEIIDEELRQIPSEILMVPVASENPSHFDYYNEEQREFGGKITARGSCYDKIEYYRR